MKGSGINCWEKVKFTLDFSWVKPHSMTALIWLGQTWNAIFSIFTLIFSSLLVIKMYHWRINHQDETSKPSQLSTDTLNDVEAISELQEKCLEKRAIRSCQSIEFFANQSNESNESWCQKNKAINQNQFHSTYKIIDPIIENRSYFIALIYRLRHCKFTADSHTKTIHPCWYISVL